MSQAMIHDADWHHDYTALLTELTAKSGQSLLVLQFTAHSLHAGPSSSDASTLISSFTGRRSALVHLAYSLFR